METRRGRLREYLAKRHGQRAGYTRRSTAHGGKRTPARVFGFSIGSKSASAGLCWIRTARSWFTPSGRPRSYTPMAVWRRSPPRSVPSSGTHRCRQGRARRAVEADHCCRSVPDVAVGDPGGRQPDRSHSRHQGASGSSAMCAQEARPTLAGHEHARHRASIRLRGSPISRRLARPVDGR